MSPFSVAVGEGREATVELDGQFYRAKVHSYGWWSLEHSRELQLELTIVIQSDKLVKKMERQFPKEAA